MGDAEGGGLIRLASPLLALLALPLAALVLARLRHLPRTMGRGRRRATQALAGLAALALALAAGGLELAHDRDALAVVVVLDRSRSIEGPGRPGTERVERELRAIASRLPPADRMGLVVVGSEAATEIAPSPRPSIGTRRVDVPRDGTDLEAGLRRALADLPDGYAGRILLVSDGNETGGDALSVADLAASRGVPIDVLPIDRAPAPEVAIEQVRVPPVAEPDEPVAIRVVTRSTRATRVRLRVRRDGVPLASGEVDLGAGEDVLVVRDRAPTAGIHRYDAEIVPLDPTADGSRVNDEGGAFLRVAGSTGVLVLASEPEGASALASALERASLRVTVRAPAQAPSTLAELASYDLVVLADTPARELSLGQLEALASYVRDLGGGLLMAGAQRSFGLGGYAYTPVEEVLPATFDLRRRRDRLSLAMVIAIDRSGSMSAPVGNGRTKLDLANEAAARSAMLLAPRDRVGVMHVDTETHWTQPMVAVTDPGAIAAACRRATSGGGGIYVDVALRDAYEALEGQHAQLSHLLLFSDGSDSEQLEGTRELVRAAIGKRITTSIVSMGTGPDTPELEVLARLGQGRFYIVDDLTQLPRIFTEETVAASRSAFVEKTFVPSVVRSGAATRGIEFESAPPLTGLALVNARPEAVVHLAASASEPLLVRWQHGLGRSAVFTTDLGARFARGWVAWPGYAALFTQLARDLARTTSASDASVSVSVDHGRGRVVVEAVSREGRYRNYLDLGASVAGPAGRSESVQLVQTGAGRYEASFDASTPGPYLVTVRDAESGLVGSFGAVRPAGDELRGEGTDRALLARLAAATHGAVRTSARASFADRLPPVRSFDPLFAPLVTLALLALLASVATRRLQGVPVPIARALERLRSPRAVPEPREPEALATITHLAATRRARRGEVPHRPEEPAEVGPALEAPIRPVDESTPRSDTPVQPLGIASEPKAAEPASLAEQLLARKRRKD